MGKRVFLHIACAVLLLISQHGAFTHAVWHLGKHASAQTHQPGDPHNSDRKDDSPQSKLCELHVSLGSLLAGDCPGQAVFTAAVLSHALPAAFFRWGNPQPAVTPPSRAPPVLL